jgi:hypothetical protein
MIAAAVEEKEEIFMVQVFLPQAVDNEDVQIPDMSADASAKQVHEALFTQSINKAPGVAGIGFKALTLLRQCTEDRVVALLQGYIRMRFHPARGRPRKSSCFANTANPRTASRKHIG